MENGEICHHRRRCDRFCLRHRATALELSVRAAGVLLPYLPRPADHRSTSWAEPDAAATLTAAKVDELRRAAAVGPIDPAVARRVLEELSGCSGSGTSSAPPSAAWTGVGRGARTC